MQIGEVAEQIGLSLRTIRYYDEIGLAPPTARTPGGFRLYTDEDVARLLLVKRMKPLGYSLEEMRDLVELMDALASEEREDERAELLGRVELWEQAVAERVAALRQQLSYAEEFSSRVAGEKERRRARTAPRA
ncbi:MerR family transcriptional regulator [Vallicoccus soli]|uniref:MerR family transcriptional regulator n=1 Tax=Vallicoccus soli TaxID=2339232 RepID=A0A3A3ZBA8_9ACTN|nr:MerR family transcriptional regulator [Vallicoccus soli]